MSTVTVTVEGRPSRPLADATSASKRLLQSARRLRDHVKRLGDETRPENPADAWLVDNYSFLQFQIRETQRALTAPYLRKLPKIAGRGLRVYRIAADFVAQSEEVIDHETLPKLAAELKQDHSLALAELWVLGSMLKLAILERMCDSPDSERVVSTSIRSLRALDSISWSELVESSSVVHSTLAQDPAGIYPHMDFATRDRYRHQVERLALGSKLSEIEIATRVVACASQAENDERRRHVGFYLVGSGAPGLERLIGYRPSVVDWVREAMKHWPNAFYIGSIVLLTMLVAAGFRWFSGPFPQWLWVLLAIPASQAAIEFVNALISRMLPPRVLASMDFSNGIPDESKTLVAVPTLLLSEANVDRLIEDLEIRYLANREPNLYFAILSDLPDADEESVAADEVVLRRCREGIRRLNARYSSGKASPFYLFHRPRLWNPSESKWMGYERKRGKLNDLNRLLLGRGNAFDTVVGDTSRLQSIRYVITLDTDTQLPRDAAVKMVAAAAHPLNQPLVDPNSGVVTEGYGVISPRVTLSMESHGRSRLVQIFGGPTGFDPYATAVSDVYQDLFGRANFVGKGIYEVRAFDAAVGNRFPENTILSHDLIEGEHAQTGLLTSVELLEDCPEHYEGFAKRRHRWVRGDWQILPYIASRTPGPSGTLDPSPLPISSRWKIFDNLRRSVMEICVLLLFICGWLAVPDASVWTLSVLGLLLLTAYADLMFAAASAPERRFWPAFAENFAGRFLEANRAALLNLILIPHQALLMADAIARTLFRRFVTKHKLLEWETMAQSAMEGTAGLSVSKRYLFLSSWAATLFLLAWTYPGAIVRCLCALWAAAPLVVMWLNQPPSAPRPLEERDRTFLRGVALRTWRFFADHSDSSSNWLIADNVQLDPPLAAHRVSPTNIGLLLSSQLAAYDFGYVTLPAFVECVERTLDTTEKLPRCHGHLLNWYNTRTLAPEPPHFVSTVDSGNLAASLCAVRQGCLHLLGQPVIGLSVLEGLRDHALRLREELPHGSRSVGLMRLFASLLRQLENQPTDLFFWESVLTDAQDTMQRIHTSLARTHSRLIEQGDLRRSEEIRYWETLLAERIHASLGVLYSVAPWLDPALEPELRLNSRDTSLAPLMADLCLIPLIAELPAVYERIGRRTRQRLRETPPLYPALRAALEELLGRLGPATTRAHELIDRIKAVAARTGRLLEEMDFRFLFDPQTKLLRVGYDAGAGCLSESSYDLLASEARSAVFLAIAKGDIPREAWFRLGRKLSAFRGQRTLLSWSGTMFEYLMPLLYMRSYSGTLLDRAMRGAVRVQQFYGAAGNLPWGISEAAHSARDGSLQYQYRAFGVPALSVNPRRTEAHVVAPYASILALMVDPRAATSNLRCMATQGYMGRYGFFESMDYARGARDPELIQSFMAHHQGMSLVAIDNALLGNHMQERFHLDPMVQATEFLLQERMPALVEVVTEPDDAAA